MGDGLTLHIKKTDEIDYMINRFPVFSSLQHATIRESDLGTNGMSRNFKWNYHENGVFKEERVFLQTMIIGQTGYGKSTLLNSIIGEEVFQTDDIESCTKELNTALFRLNCSENHYLALSDLPGIGEGATADAQYMEWYKGMINTSSCIVYTLNADKRSHTPDHQVFKALFDNSAIRSRLIIALTCADKVGNNRTYEITPEQTDIINRKISEVKKLFGNLTVVPCSGKTGWNIDKLIGEIVPLLRKDTVTVPNFAFDSLFRQLYNHMNF